MTLERPWQRIKNPTAIPDAVEADWLTRLDEVSFAELLRDNLTPGGPQTRPAWDRLWQVLSGDDDLADRAYDVLEQFLDAIDRAEADSSVLDAEHARVVKFRTFVDGAWSRLERPTRAKTPKVTRAEKLVFAITRHRALKLERSEAITPADQELWQQVEAMGLDSGPAPRGASQ